MAKIDDPDGKIREQYLEESRNPALSLTIEVAKGIAEKVSWESWVASKVIGFLQSKAREASSKSFQQQIVERCAALGKEFEEFKVKLEAKSPNEEESVRLLTVAYEKVLWGANEEKVRRFASIVTDTIFSAEEQSDFEDAASLIRALNELSEEDLRVLKLFFHYQKELVTEGHGMPHGVFFDGNRMTLLQEGILQLGMQIDDVYSRCNRLVGYGLLLPLERTQGQGDINVRNFRITLLGKRLMIILINVGNEPPEFRAVC